VKITVTTPTGHIGSKLSNLLLDRGAEVTVIARATAKVKELAGRGARVIAGDHSDPAVVKRAIEGADSLFWLIPPNYTTKDPRGEYRKFADAAATAISQFPQIKLVLLSSVGANRTEGVGPIKGSHDAEEKLRATVKNLTAVRANYFMENALSSLPTIISDGNIYSVVPGSATTPQIATADIATISADVLLAGRDGQHIIDLAGPEDISFDQVAETLSKTIGKTVGHVVVADEALVAGLSGAGLSPELARELVEMQHAFAKGVPHEFLGEQKLTGKMTFAQFAREVFLPAYRHASASAA
jgi:uncharacterized protein YbjT (DUF2867 family)